MLEIYLLDWLSLAIKFLHVIAGIAWIGASFYFNWLENKLHRAGNRDGIAGHLWAVHGGGFYYLEKYAKYPEKMPDVLHWFKWEAYITWISGILLLAVVYYLNADSYLLMAGSTLNPAYAVGLSMLGLAVLWVIYDLMCKTRIVDKPVIFTVIIAVLIAISAYLYGLVFNPRAVFMQIGAMLGTIMAGNVFFVIIPVQRKLVAACEEKTNVSKALGYKGYIRSRHNNYFTLPVLFIMISNHYPFIFSSQLNWLVLIAVFLIAFLIRHYFNLRGIGKPGFALIGIIAVLLIALIVTLAPKLTSNNNSQAAGMVKVKQIIQNRCVSCHSATPTDDIFIIAPSGFILDTEAQIMANKQLIYTRTVATNSMPFANKTQMTQAERDYLGAWAVSKDN